MVSKLAVRSSALRRDLEWVLLAVKKHSKKDIKPDYTGICFTAATGLVLVGTNGYKLHISFTPEANPFGKSSCAISIKDVDTILKGLGQISPMAGESNIYRGRVNPEVQIRIGMAWVEVNGKKFKKKAHYPGHGDFIEVGLQLARGPEEQPAVTVPVKPMLALLRKSTRSSIQFRFHARGPGCISVTKDYGIWQSIKVISRNRLEFPNPVYFNKNLLWDSLRNVESRNVDLFMLRDSSPLYIIPRTKGTLAIVMPLNRTMQQPGGKNKWKAGQTGSSDKPMKRRKKNARKTV